MVRENGKKQACFVLATGDLERYEGQFILKGCAHYHVPAYKLIDKLGR